MNQTTTTSILLSVVGLAVLLWLGIAGVASNPVVTVNGIDTRDLGKIVALTNSQTDVTSGRYDSFESPRGTNYQVPAGQTLYLAHIEGQSGSVGGLETIRIGYSTETVDNQVASPAGAVTVMEFSLNSATTDAHRDIFIPIPEGMYPWISMTGSGNLQATGFLR